jgi:hypothetical protein
MTWKLVEEKNILVPIADTNKHTAKEEPDGMAGSSAI